MRPGDGRHRLVAGHATCLTSDAGDREERHEGDALLPAGAHELVMHTSEGSRPGPTFVVMTSSSAYGESAVLISSLADRSGEK